MNRYRVRGTTRDGQAIPMGDTPPCDLPSAVRLAAALEAHGSTVRIFAVGEDGTETMLPTYEEALAEIARGRTVTAGIGAWVESLAARPVMYGSPCCVETQALQAMRLRRQLLGVERDGRHGPGPARGVYDGLYKERFGESNTPAYCHLRDPDEHVALQKIGEFVGEWWRREKEATGQ